MQKLRIKKEMFDSLMKYQELRTGLTKGQIYEKHDLNYAIVSKARLGGHVAPKTVFRIASMLECDPVELVIEEDLPKQMKEKKKRGNGNEA